MLVVLRRMLRRPFRKPARPSWSHWSASSVTAGRRTRSRCSRGCARRRAPRQTTTISLWGWSTWLRRRYAYPDPDLLSQDYCANVTQKEFTGVMHRSKQESFPPKMTDASSVQNIPNPNKTRLSHSLIPNGFVIQTGHFFTISSCCPMQKLYMRMARQGLGPTAGSLHIIVSKYARDGRVDDVARMINVHQSQHGEVCKLRRGVQVAVINWLSVSGRDPSPAEMTGRLKQSEGKS
jgi:hypothetical protein